MLGKDHVSITLGTVFPFTIPLIFSDNPQPVYAFCVLVAAIIGSLTPDADCGGKPKLHYDFKIVYDLMVPLHKLIVFSFSFFNLKEKMNLEYVVEEQHRGVMHSPIGVLISSFVLTLLTTIVGYFIFHGINATLIGFLFLGLISGQFLHLLEDSCTVSGIRWLFPFGTGELKGSIYTGNKIEGKKDIRPLLYRISLLFFSAGLLILHSLGAIDVNDSGIYLLIFAFVALIWGLIFLTAKIDNDNLWMQDAKKVRELERAVNRIGKQDTVKKRRNLGNKRL
ncbi:MAG: metal-dependent hydrolase [Methanosarcina sp.]|uniref:metal-dependent hydrolase n=1 Tax=Methanosarcina sp. TaxID=2213 RepID=UPI002632FCDC|nr:metal-dependent hydrolase [Methanosarcina sp.]MDD3247043.1 metal-dependent hydrolase [Methanosarcina sp.]